MSNFLSSNPNDLARVLSDENRSIEEREAQGRAKALNLEYVNLQNFPLDLTALGVITEKEAKESEVIPFFKDHHDLRLGTNNPDNPNLKVIVEQLKKSKEAWNPIIYFISESSFNSTIKFYNKVVRPSSKFQDMVQFTSGSTSTELQNSLNKEGVSASDVLNNIFASAVAQNSSDIHLEPEEQIVKIRFRIDGVLHDAAQIPKAAHHAIISRIKLMAKLKLNVENVSQDGRFSVLNNNEPLDVRVSVLPSNYGEAVVMRLLGIGSVNLGVKDLGLLGKAFGIVEEQIHKPNGMILTTGPTGSGKTTTLYAFLRELNNSSVKIITLEDPIEYKVEGIQQTPIDHRVDFNFAKGLRAVLRQDPDILMVGEIRDPETAETALQAALTGHVVLSTLHTNDAAGAVPRLITMGVKPFTIAPAINSIIAQRLVRRLCTSCVKPIELSALILEKVEKVLSELPKNCGVEVPRTQEGKLQFYDAEGCTSCGGLGYKGRVGVYEVIEVNDEMRELILKDGSIIDVKKAAHENGTMTMLQDGLLKALNKITDVDEVYRVIG